MLYLINAILIFLTAILFYNINIILQQPSNIFTSIQ
jgi:hypothetical protein